MTPACVALGRGHTSSVYALSLSDHLLASGGEDGWLCFWSLDQSSVPINSIHHVDPCSVVKFVPSNHNTLFSAHGQTICLWDLRLLRHPVSEWNVNEDEVNSIDVLEVEACLAAADDSGAVKIIDVTSGSVVRTLTKHDNICSAAVFRPNRNWQLVSGGLDCRIIVTDWKGSGLGVIIFELDEIIGCRSENLPASAGEPAHDSSSDDSDSYVSTGANAELRHNALGESGSGNSDEDASLPASLAVQESDAEDGCAWISQPQSLSAEVNERMASGSAVSSQIHTDSRDSPVLQPTSTSAYDTWSLGLPVNPPMVHSIACSVSGDLIAAGLENSTIELFAGNGKRLAHTESLYGHRRSVSALHFIGDTFLLSGGTDLNLVLWTFSTEVEKRFITLDAKVNAIQGKDLQKTFIADCSPFIRLLDLSIC